MNNKQRDEHLWNLINRGCKFAELTQEDKEMFREKVIEVMDRFNIPFELSSENLDSFKILCDVDTLLKRTFDKEDLK
jgi:hypothetical protein